MNQSQVLKSKQICKKCKGKLLRRRIQKNKITFGMFKKKKVDRRSLKDSLENKVYVNQEIIKKYQEDNFANLNLFFVQFKENLRKNKINEDNSLKNFSNVLIKILCAKNIDFNDLQALTKNEITILFYIIKKKKFNGFEHPELSISFFNKLNKKPIYKKSEENMKYIIKKAFKFLQNYFKNHLFAKLKIYLRNEFKNLKELSEFEYAFFGFYFGSLAKKINQSIEKFFTPRNSNSLISKKKKLISKTVSRLYLSYLKMSKVFIKDLIYYLDNFLVQETILRIEEKVFSMCINWDQIIKTYGWDHLLAQVKFNFEDNPKTKVLWSLLEVKLAIKEVKEFMLISS
jgi:hypothetical protein